MKRLLFALIVLLFIATVGHAQSPYGIYPSPPWCNGCFVASHSDSPSAGSVITGSTVIWTWAGVCNSGAVPTSVSATANVNGQPVSVAVGWAIGGQRPDVTAHLQANGCQGGHAVIPLWFTSGLPSGTTAVSVHLNSEGIYAYHNFLVR